MNRAKLVEYLENNFNDDEDVDLFELAVDQTGLYPGALLVEYHTGDVNDTLRDVLRDENGLAATSTVAALLIDVYTATLELDEEHAHSIITTDDYRRKVIINLVDMLGKNEGSN